jgi:transposase-like protein
MRLILTFGEGGGRSPVLSNGFYPYTQKPVDYQPYRPVYLFRGPPPDAGFSYGLFEDEETGKKYYADLGLDSFSPLSGKSAKLLEELTSEQIERLLGEDVKKDNLSKRECAYCGADYFDNFHLGVKGRDNFFCHRCGSKLTTKEEPQAQEADGTMTDHTAKDSNSSISKDPSVKTFIENGISILTKSTQMKELSERLATRYSIPPEKAKHDILIALKDAIR